MLYLCSPADPQFSYHSLRRCYPIGMILSSIELGKPGQIRRAQGVLLKIFLFIGRPDGFLLLQLSHGAVFLGLPNRARCRVCFRGRRDRLPQCKRSGFFVVPMRGHMSVVPDHCFIFERYRHMIAIRVLDMNAIFDCCGVQSRPTNSG